VTGPCNVLVVEDDDDIRESLVDVLTEYGHVVHAVTNGAEAIVWLEQAATMPGLILLDLMMPVMDGFVFRAMQRTHARWASIPVVVLSAHAASETRREELQANAVFKKPLGVSAIRDIVDQHCQNAA